jgi:hypothetical protein
MYGLPRPRARRGVPWGDPIAPATLVAALLPAALLGCGGEIDTRAPAAGSADAAQPAPRACAGAISQAFAQIAALLYREFAQGRVVEPAVHRLQRSPALVAAAQSGDRSATAAALRALVHGQLTRVRVVTAAGRTLAEYGSGEAIAPVSVPLTGAAGATIGAIVASEQSARGYVDTVRTFAGAQVLVRAGSRQLAGTTTRAPATLPNSGEISFAGVRHSVHSFPGTRFPAGTLRVYVLSPPPPASACAPTPAQTTADALGAAAAKIYRDERSGPRARMAVRDLERSRAFQRAVAGGDTPATQAAIVALFKTRLHLVRVRALLGSRLVADVGGPRVIAPVEGRVRDAQGRVVGSFLLSIQDDLGYEILAHRFTGAQVLLRQGGRQILGSLTPGPASVPDRGAVRYGGMTYHAYSFLARAFPSGTLRVSLLYR